MLKRVQNGLKLYSRNLPLGSVFLTPLGGLVHGRLELLCHVATANFMTVQLFIGPEDIPGQTLVDKASLQTCESTLRQAVGLGIDSEHLEAICLVWQLAAP